MIRRTWTAALLFFAAAISPAPALAGGAEAPAAPQGEWISLFNGKSLDGWSVVELPGQKSKWEVVDGLLCGSGQASMIVTDKGGFKNFRFRAEIRINDKGNSGMYFRTTEKPGFTDGYECQINSTHSDPIRTGSIYTLVHVFDTPVNPDEWFTQEVEVKDVDFRGKMVTQVTVKVDGKVLYTTNDFARTWKTGHFAFQQHDPGSVVMIRKVEVMELPAAR